MRLTKLTSYALRILIHCGQRPGKVVKASDIARAYQITEANVSKVVQFLVRAGLLETIRGPLGGLKLARTPSEIRVGDVVRATEETTIQAECFGHGAEACAIRQAVPINRVFDNAIDAFIEVLDRHTLEEFIRARPGAALFAQMDVLAEATRAQDPIDPRAPLPTQALHQRSPRA